MVTSATIVRLDSVTKRYGGLGDPAALTDVTLSVQRGEVVGVIGESGAGKTTLMNLIAGLELADAGSVTVSGRDVGALGRAGRRGLRRDIGVLFQGVHLLSSRTVRDNVALPLRLRGRASSARRAEQRRQVDEILSFVGLSHRSGHYPAQLSGGQRQRVGLARALVSRPTLLLCDEPTSSLDSSTTAEVLAVIDNARAELGATVVMITHDLDVVKAVCDRAVLLAGGRLREEFPITRTGYRTLPSYAEQVRRELGS